MKNNPAAQLARRRRGIKERKSQKKARAVRKNLELARAKRWPHETLE